MRVVFWGTPDFALPSLRALLAGGHEVPAVVTRPDRPAGRGRRLKPPPVRVEAERRGIRVLQPERPRGEEFLEQLASLEPDLSVVAAYGEILIRRVLDLPTHGSINVHASLLPKLRGAAPVNWAIIRGCPRTGVTIMRMVEQLDAGPILHQTPLEIGPATTAGELSESLAELGARALIEALERLATGELAEREQDHEQATYAPKLSADEARLDWSRGADEIGRWIRGCDPLPGAWSMLGDLRVRLFGPTPMSGGPPGGAAAGTVLAASPADGFVVAAGSGRVRIEEVQPAGKRRMRAEAWVRGRGVESGQRLR